MTPLSDCASTAAAGTSSGKGAAPLGGRDVPAAGAGADRRRGAGPRGARFRTALEGGDAVPGLGAAAAGAAPASWSADLFRPAGPARAPGTASAASAPPAVDRVLIGAGSGGAEARIRIAGGALGGSEIRLVSAPGGGSIEAEILTSVAGSRQTLVGAMDEIRRRLREKGIALSTARARQAPSSTTEGRRRAPARRG